MNSKHIPKKDDTIRWFGTEYKVDSVEGDTVKVTMNNGIQIDLWWRETEGCSIIKKER